VVGQPDEELSEIYRRWWGLLIERIVDSGESISKEAEYGNTADTQECELA
jgi:hypothetical protein